jgi:hypothetical protein
MITIKVTHLANGLVRLLKSAYSHLLPSIAPFPPKTMTAFVYD